MDTSKRPIKASTGVSLSQCTCSIGYLLARLPLHLPCQAQRNTDPSRNDRTGRLAYAFAADGKKFFTANFIECSK